MNDDEWYSSWYRQTISGDDAIWKHLNYVGISRPCTHSDKKDGNASFCGCFSSIPLKDMLCYLISDLKTIKLQCRWNFSFWRMYKFVMLCFLSHRIFWIWPQWASVRGESLEWPWKRLATGWAATSYQVSQGDSDQPGANSCLESLEQPGEHWIAGKASHSQRHQTDLRALIS